MAQVTKTVLKTYFNTGDLPTESNFVDLIDSSQSTLVAGNNISLTSQSNGSVKIDANVSNKGIIHTFNNSDELATILKSFTDNSTPGIAVFIPKSSSVYFGTWDFNGVSAPFGTIVIIQERQDALVNPGLTLNGLGIYKRTQLILSVKNGVKSSMASAILIRTYRTWEIVGSVGEVKPAD